MALARLPANTREFEIFVEAWWVRLEESRIEQEVGEDEILNTCWTSS